MILKGQDVGLLHGGVINIIVSGLQHETLLFSQVLSDWFSSWFQGNVRSQTRPGAGWDLAEV